MELLSIYASIGRGSSEKIKLHFPNLVPVALPEYERDKKEILP
jgi:hypothetical protein